MSAEDAKFISELRAKLKGTTPGSIFDLVAKQRADIARLVAEGPRPVTFKRRRGGWAVVADDPSKPGRWRVTFLDEEVQPTGHIEAATFEAAIKEAIREGADPSTAESYKPASIFTPPAPTRDCTHSAPNAKAIRHEAVVEVRTVMRRDGEHTLYRCEDCGAEWDA